MLAPKYRVRDTTITSETVDLEGPTPTFIELFLITLNMRSLLLSLCLLTVVVSRSTQQNHPRNDNININAILQNDRILLGYYKCVMDKGPCTKDGKIFKRALPEALPTACGRCTPKQKLAFRTLLLAIRAKSEPRFLELLDKYDPNRASRDGLYKFLATGV